jgi:hypothetical protein
VVCLHDAVTLSAIRALVRAPQRTSGTRGCSAIGDSTGSRRDENGPIEIRTPAKRHLAGGSTPSHVIVAMHQHADLPGIVQRTIVEFEFEQGGFVRI